jgi:hypothetical protein
MDTTTRQSTMLATAGAAFLILAGFFLWRDLSLPRELVMSVLALVAGTAAALRWPRRWPALAPAVLIATTIGAACWFTTEKQVALLPPLGIALVTAAAAVVRSLHDGEGKLADRLIWYAFGASLLAVTWGLYFHFLTAGFAADWVARRMIPTVAWLALGLSFFIAGKGRIPAAVHVGLGFIGIAVTKAALYDTSHLHGYLRIGALAAVGALLVFGGRVLGSAGAAAVPARKELV